MPQRQRWATSSPSLTPTTATLLWAPTPSLTHLLGTQTLLSQVSRVKAYIPSKRLSKISLATSALSSLLASRLTLSLLHPRPRCLTPLVQQTSSTSQLQLQALRCMELRTHSTRSMSPLAPIHLLQLQAQLVIGRSHSIAATLPQSAKA